MAAESGVGVLMEHSFPASGRAVFLRAGCRRTARLWNVSTVSRRRYSAGMRAGRCGAAARVAGTGRSMRLRTGE
ncbi:hypothetical protein DY218_01375 [Streptomyces triticagri]|uniref:Uncharacterized protein n=1 Tax=Streptomyces triticagri TaxID=2293568 RepID=A0A372MDW4_9ACTN|nr:hypothetical protein DY218_01375 [Streptomyces triticagri]